MNSARPTATDRERRARLVRRHLLSPDVHATRAEDVAEALVGLHATDPATVYLSARARMSEPSVDAVERALYDDRTLHRLLAMRRTMFVVPDGLADLVHDSTGRAIADRELRDSQRFLQEAFGWDPDHRAGIEATVLAALRARGEATAAELAEDVPALAERVVIAPGKPYESTQAASSRLLRSLAARRLIERGRPRGSWASAQFRWRAADATEATGRPAHEARADLVRHYLARFGPVTLADVKWWTGWTLTASRTALADVGAVEVDLAEGTGYLAPDDVEPVGDTSPSAALLPGLDPTSMGWRDRGFYLDPDHVPALFDRNGNIGPTVWWDGRVVGAWAQRPDGSIGWRALADVGAEAAARIDAETDRLAAWLEPTRVKPSYRTPLERELAEG
ncbi:winged helix DNA-binding domain-containing protein [Nocardiopsis sp. NPDC049922]|uniref:winged helix DNA-binding domain-containing protein n=1 Tax=Nocardiopsis sp. NPDC049922 TaxID=3155157 RepID=UPI0033C15D80